MQNNNTNPPEVLIDGVLYVPKVEAEVKAEWPRLGDAFSVISADGFIIPRAYDNDGFDKAVLASGNAFPSHALAQTALAKRKAQATIDRYIAREGIENGFAVGGENRYPYFNRDSHQVELSPLSPWDGKCQISTIFNVRTESEGEQIVAACGNEIKILLSIED